MRNKRIVHLRGYKEAVTLRTCLNDRQYAGKVGYLIELKTGFRSSVYFAPHEIQAIEYCPWNSDRIFGQNFAIVTLVDGQRIKTGATVGEIKHCLKQAKKHSLNH
tara:strand:+ start:156 stop:470 length:315 start_codon:yes stop_codon:yes gene_type:complete